MLLCIVSPRPIHHLLLGTLVSLSYRSTIDWPCATFFDNCELLSSGETPAKMLFIKHVDNDALYAYKKTCNTKPKKWRNTVTRPGESEPVLLCMKEADSDHRDRDFFPRVVKVKIHISGRTLFLLAHITWWYQSCSGKSRVT